MVRRVEGKRFSIGVAMNFDLAIKRLEQLKVEKKELKGMLDLYQNILEFQKAMINEQKRDLPMVTTAVDKPLLGFLGNLEGDILSKAAGKFFKFLLSFGTSQMKAAASGAMENDSFKPEKINATFLDYIKDGKVVPGVSPEFLRLTVFSVAPIFLSPLSEKLEKELPEDFESVTCPFCGSKAQVGYLSKSENGRRYIVCPVCYGKWHIKRDRCANCGNEGLEENYYLFVDNSNEDEHCKIEICDKCNHYIKSVDERILDKKGIPCVPFVEDLATVYLDIKVLAEGYKKTNPSLFGF